VTFCLRRAGYKFSDIHTYIQGGQLVGLMPVLAACHLIYVFSVVLHCISIHVVANKVLSLSLFSECLKESLLMAGSLRLSDNQFHYHRAGHRKSPLTITAETMARHNEKNSAGREKVLSGGDTGDRLAEVDDVHNTDRQVNSGQVVKTYLNHHLTTYYLSLHTC